MTTSVQYTRPPWCQERLHRWAMWRITVNQELIHGLDSCQREGQNYHSFMDNYSFTQRYIQNPQMEREQTYYIRNAYGMTPSAKYPMGDTLYFLYGLPRASTAVRLPDVMSSHYTPRPLLTIFETDTKIEPVRRHGGLAPDILLYTHSHQTKSVDENKNLSVPTIDIYPPRNEQSDILQVSNRENGLGQTSPVNFRDKPETDFQHVHPAENSQKVNNINKPVLVPPSVFQSEVLKRSNIDLPLNIIYGHGLDNKSGEAGDFQDPRDARFNERPQIYTWSDTNNGDIDAISSQVNVDESHMKTHM